VSPSVGDRSPGSFLLIRPGGIGDATLLLPAIRAIKEAFSEAVIDVLAEKRNAQVFSFSPHVRQVFLYDHRSELLRVLRGRYDVVIDTEQWHRLSAGIARLIRSSMKIGYGTNERKKLFTNAILYEHDDYEADSFFKLLKPFGITHPDNEISFIQLKPSARKRAGELLGDLSQAPFVVIFPGASIPERRWGAENFQAVAEALESDGVPSIVVGGREDAAEGIKIVTARNGLNLAGRTNLAETAAIIETSALLLSGDSGILHIGVGLGKPTVSLFGPGIAEKWAPRGDNHIVLNKNLPCSPCTRFGTTPECPIGARCLQEISPDEVASAVRTLLKRTTEGI
jgi:ADP-heptose:LPS heptosyltransferase